MVSTGAAGDTPSVATSRPTVTEPPDGIRPAQSAPRQWMSPLLSVQARPQLLEMAVACRSGQLTDQPSTGSPAAVTTSWAT